MKRSAHAPNADRSPRPQQSDINYEIIEVSSGDHFADAESALDPKAWQSRRRLVRGSPGLPASVLGKVKSQASSPN
jgi:hypothetical protein